ncbi:MAG: TraB/GumN family protein [Bacteroidetes bacterium]|nr:MAG: TraB/GumN family protein [Bacteroidota bacterium]
MLYIHHMLQKFLPLTLLALSVTLTAQEPTGKLKGLLWEISGNGINRPGYLYGTMHVPEKLAFNLSDSFFTALRGVDMVALETNHDDWQAFTEVLNGRESELFNPGYGDSYASGSSRQPNLYNTQFAFRAPDNRLLGALLSSKPRMTNEFLYRSNQYRQDYEEDTYLDLFIFQAGRKLGKTVIGLETLEGSYEALVRAQLPDDEEEEETDRGYYPGQYSRTTMEEAYRDQDLSLLDSLNRIMQPGKNFRRWMLDERNLIMLNGIDSVLQSGSSLFSAVGAAHLPGDMGLIRLLQQKGYTVRPVSFTADSSKTEMDEIKALRYPVEFSRQWAADSTWSVEAPGKFYQTVDGMGLEQQLCADMSNGAYYAVYRVTTYGLWNGQDPAYMAERIDSLIYEKIPGKIQERIRFDEPFPGHQITTRTRRGDIIRYKIYATPMEVLVFATGGNGDYAAGPESARFINSIRFHRQKMAPGAQPVVIEPPQGGFRVELPAAPIFNTTSNRNADRYLFATVDPRDSSFYIVYRAAYHDWDYIEEDSFELNIIGEKLAANFTKAPPTFHLVATAPYPTQDATFQAAEDSAWYFTRLIIDGPHYYLLACRKQTPDRPDAFFNSFVNLPNEYPGGWETLRDSSMQFSVEVPKASLRPEHPFLEKLRQIIEEGMQKSKYNSRYSGAGPRSRRTTLDLPLQGEQISIESNELLRTGPAPTLDSFQAFVNKMITDGESLVIRKKTWQNPDDRLLIGDFLLADTNSTRGIRARVILTPGRMYNLMATVHLDVPETPFVQRVFDTFTTTDTTSGKLIFGRRNMDFLRKIYSEDSLVQAKALSRLESSWSRSYQPEDFPLVQEAILHPGFGQLKYSSRHTLLRTLSQFPGPEGLQFVLNIPERYPDSMRYHQLVIQVLADMQTRPAQRALIQLLERRDKFVTRNTISEVFDALRDTIEMSVSMVPRLLDLYDRQNFGEETLHLLDLAVQRKLITPRVYRRLKPRLLEETYLFLGQQLFNAEKKRDQGEDDRYGNDYYSPYSNETSFKRNLRLLAPFLHKDAAVRALFHQTMRSPEKEVQIIAICLMLQQHFPVREKTLLAFAEDDRTRYTLYSELEETGQLNTHGYLFRDTIALVRSILFERALEQDDREKGGLDSIRFISQHYTMLYGVKAMIYFFDVKKKKTDNWMLAYVTVPTTASLFNPKAETDQAFRRRNYYRSRPNARILEELPRQEKDTYIREKIGEIRFANRDRYRRQSDSEYYYDE